MSRLCLRAAFDRRLLRRSLRSPCFLRSALSRQRVVRTSLWLVVWLALALAPAQAGDAEAAGARASAPAATPTAPRRRMSVRVRGMVNCLRHPFSRQFAYGSLPAAPRLDICRMRFGAGVAGGRGRGPPPAVPDIARTPRGPKH